MMKRARVHVDAAKMDSLAVSLALAEAKTPLDETSDDALLAELKRRNVALDGVISDETVATGYQVGAKLGEGASAAVFDVTERNGQHRHLALKHIEVREDINDIESMSAELSILKQLRHPCVIELVEVGFRAQLLPLLAPSDRQADCEPLISPPNVR